MNGFDPSSISFTTPLPKDFKGFGGNYDDYKLDKPIDFGGSGSGRKNRGSGIFKAVAENLQRRKNRDEDLDARAKKAKQLASQYQQGAFQVSEDTTVLPGYRDEGFEVTEPGSPGFGQLIGTVGGAVIGSAFGNPMMGANIGGKVGSYF